MVFMLRVSCYIQLIHFTAVLLKISIRLRLFIAFYHTVAFYRRVAN